MEDFKTYYLNSFQKDLYKFFETIPEESKFHEDRERKQIYSIQFSRLNKSSKHLDFLSCNEKALFGISLFYLVLADMVCYTHFSDHYQKFQELTRYPKFIGNCPGACHYHFHPSRIFSAMNYELNESDEEWIDFRGVQNETVSFIRNEIMDFFNNHLTEIDGDEFWQKYKREFPYYV